MVYSVENFHIFSNAEVLRLLINSASGRLVQKKIISKNIKFLIFWYSEQALFLYLLVTTSMTIFKSLSFPLKVLTSCAQFFTGSFCFVVKKIAFFFPAMNFKGLSCSSACIPIMFPINQTPPTYAAAEA